MKRTRRYSAYELLTARKLAGFTQEDVIDALHLKSKGRVSEWENGLRYPSVKNLFKLSALYQTLEAQLLYEVRQKAVEEIDQWLKKRNENNSNVKNNSP